jgi:hypothetical protein
LPKVLLEACAAGHVIVTTDIPGCQDVAALAAGIGRLLEDPQLRNRMGMATSSSTALEGLESQELQRFRAGR